MKTTLPTICLMICLFISCGKQCEDAKVGDVSLIESSLEYVPYTDGQTIKLVSTDGSELSFTVEKMETAGRICTKYLCSNTSSPFQNVPCEYVQSTNVRNVLRSGDTLIIDINLVIENYQEESMLFYDLVSMNFSGIGALASASHVTNVHFTDPTFDQNTIFRDPYFVIHNDYEINGQTFTDVIVSPEGSNQLVFKKGEGIVAVKYLDKVFF